MAWATQFKGYVRKHQSSNLLFTTIYSSYLGNVSRKNKFRNWRYGLPRILWTLNNNADSAVMCRHRQDGQRPDSWHRDLLLTHGECLKHWCDLRSLSQCYGNTKRGVRAHTRRFGPMTNPQKFPGQSEGIPSTVKHFENTNQKQHTLETVSVRSNSEYSQTLVLTKGKYFVKFMTETQWPLQFSAPSISHRFDNKLINMLCWP